MSPEKWLKEEDYVDFGVGTVYCLGLFLCHLKTFYNKTPEFWIDGAKDHLVCLQIPRKASNVLKQKLLDIKNQAISLSSDQEVFRDELEKLIQDVVDALFLIDKEILEVKTEEAGFL